MARPRKTIGSSERSSTSSVTLGLVPRAHAQSSNPVFLDRPNTSDDDGEKGETREERGVGTARSAFKAAFDLIGGSEALAAWAMDKPTEFYRLFARLIPLSADAGAAVDPLEVEIVRFSDPDIGPDIEDTDADDPAA